MTREAHVLAFNDVFRLVASLCLLFLGWSLFHTLRQLRNSRQARLQAAGLPPDAKATP